jgi:cell wall-associated NlpC family hydrolase
MPGPKPGVQFRRMMMRSTGGTATPLRILANCPGEPRYNTPPRGALVFWKGTNSYPQYDSEDGHVAISVGNGQVISTEQGNSGPDVHIVGISAVTAEGGGTYLGWIMPISGYQIQQ